MHTSDNFLVLLPIHPPFRKLRQGNMTVAPLLASSNAVTFPTPSVPPDEQVKETFRERCSGNTNIIATSFVSVTCQDEYAANKLATIISFKISTVFSCTSAVLSPAAFVWLGYVLI